MAWLRRLLRDHVVIINAGRLRFAGSLAELDADGRSLEDAFLHLTAPTL